jgi:hypothetical protein
MITRFGIEAAGRAGVRLLEVAGVSVSRDTVLRAVMHQRLPFDPDREPVPKVLSVDDVAIRRGHRYATMILDAVTHRRVDVLPDRLAETLSDWLKAHPGAQIVCRDGSSTYAQAIRDGAPAARSRSATAGTCGTVSARPSRNRLRPRQLLQTQHRKRPHGGSARGQGGAAHRSAHSRATPGGSRSARPGLRPPILAAYSGNPIDLPTPFRDLQYYATAAVLNRQGGKSLTAGGHPLLYVYLLDGRVGKSSPNPGASTLFRPERPYS